jgi:hypothetical protein
MSDAHIALKSKHMTSMKYIAHQTIILTHEKTMTITGYDSCGILTTMLQYRQSIV